MTATDHTTQTHAVNKLLPFPAELYTDMGGDDWNPRIYFGNTDPASDLRDNRAGIDTTWWLELDQGTTVLISPHGADVDPATIAAWITTTLTEQGYTL